MKEVETIKKKLILDFDGVIVNTIKAICDCYSDTYKNQYGYRPPRWWEVNTWDFRDECPLLEEKMLNHFFNSKEFFDKLEFMPWADEYINDLSDMYEIVVCTIGTKANLVAKKEWLNKYLPCVKKFIGIDFHKYDNKSHIDMSNCIFVDDCSRNLDTSNAATKICFGDIYEWNEHWDGIRAYNWTDLYFALT